MSNAYLSDSTSIGGVKQNAGQALSSKASDNVPNAYWNRDNRQANLNRNDPTNRDDNIGARLW